jgi:hypothetical protein
VSAEPPRRRVGALLLAATLLIGIAWILVTPPFEGFDETAHYSSLREIADTGSVPRYGQSRMATVVDAYGAQAPLPYMQAHGVPLERPISYRDFASSDAARAAFVSDFASVPGMPRTYAPGTSLNWQAQHPPLYYLALAPLVRATDGMSLVGQMAALRVASWLMAVAGLAAGVWGTARYLRQCSDAVRRAAGAERAASAEAARCASLHALPAACLAYPFLMPMFFPEFARIGNDSMCLLIFGACWALMLSMLDNHRAGTRISTVHAIALGTCLGAGLLTKAFFIPIAVGMVGYLAWVALRSGSSGSSCRIAMRHVAVTVAVALAVGGWWYAAAYLQHGALTGGNDMIVLERDGGLLAGLKERFTWQHLGRGVAGFIVTAYFAGTWTLARLPIWIYMPGLMAVGLLCVMGFRRWQTARASRLLMAALWVIVPMLAGFAYYMLVRIAGGSEGHGTPGWYMNILAPACAVPLALGMIALSRRHRGAWIARAMWLWMVAFVAITLWMHAALYAGVAVKDMETRTLACPDGWGSLLDVGKIRTGLSVFGWPVAGMACLAAGTLLALSATWRAWRFPPTLTDDAAPGTRAA